jgi:hypothetical protein
MALMKKFNLLVLGLCLAAPLSVFADTITDGVYVGDLEIQAQTSPAEAGNLIIEGTLDVHGVTMALGEADSSNPGVTITYTDDASGSTTTIALTARRANASWKWQQNASGTVKDKMKLDAANQLILYGSDGTTVGMTLNPAGDSTVANSVVINGTDNRMPNQTLTGNSSVLTRTLGDARYMSKDASTVSLNASASSNWGTAFGTSGATAEYATASGYYSQASGARSVAMGQNAVASGIASVSFGEGTTANNSNSIAIGRNTTASGFVATAMGNGTTASNWYATAIGSGTVASGRTTLAMGNATTAQGYGQLVLGQYNILQGDGTNWVGTDDIFIIGNGTGTSARSNAFTIKKNGNTQINGATGSTAGPGLKVTGDGGVVFEGTLDEGQIPATGLGTRMMWYPKKAAFRAGYFNSNSASDSNIGGMSVALGQGIASGGCSIALTGGEAVGDYSVAIGIGSSGIGSYVSGYAATALGGGRAEGTYSFAAGNLNEASSYASVVIGQAGIAEGDPVEWNATDSLFVVGNGEEGSPSNALVMRKNASMRTGGTFEAKGVIRCAPGGGLSMGTFTEGQNPSTLDAGLKYSGE